MEAFVPASLYVICHPALTGSFGFPPAENVNFYKLFFRSVLHTRDSLQSYCWLHRSLLIADEWKEVAARKTDANEKKPRKRLDFSHPEVLLILICNLSELRQEVAGRKSMEASIKSAAAGNTSINKKSANGKSNNGKSIVKQ